MKRLTVFPIFLILALFVVSESQATVFVDDADSNVETEMNAGIISAEIPTGSGMAGDYQLIACGVSATQLSTSFVAPTPGVWTELDQGDCGFAGECVHGIWGRFTDTEASEAITCAWVDPSFVFAAGSFRYNDVDLDNPIIAVECASGQGEGGDITATAPSVITEAGSQVARIFTYENSISQTTEDFNFNNDIMGSFESFAAVTSINVNMEGETELFENGGPTGEETLIVGQEVATWRACTIALRMAVPGPRPIPTMSEWGFIAVAAFLGLAGVWFLRRRQAANV